MTQRLEDQLRNAFQEKAGQIPAVAPPLELAPRPRRASRPGQRRELAGWLTPGQRRFAAGLAAVAAVAAVAVATVVVSSQSAPPKPPADGSAAKPPPYYVAIANTANTNSGRNVAVVRATGTGAVIATIQAPRPYTGFRGVTSAADDRTFVLDAVSYASVAVPEKLYRLRIDPGAQLPAQRARLTPLDVRLPKGTGVGSLALSPDGQSLAVVGAGAAMTANRIIVFNLTTDASHSWQDRGCPDSCIIGGNLAADSELNTISWTGDGRWLGFDQETGRAGRSQFRLLNVRAPGDDVLADSRPVSLQATPAVLKGVNPRDATWGIALISPDGSSLVIDAANLDTSPGPVPAQNLLRYSARTGALQAVLDIQPYRRGAYADQVLWTSPDGSTVLVIGLRGQHSAGLLHEGHYTRIPWSSQLQSAAW